MNVNIIVAHDKNRVIGNNGYLPWHIPEDLKHFKKTTQGCPIIMGRHTFDSLPIKPLPNRMNIVVSRHVHFSIPDRLTSAKNLTESLEIAKNFSNEVFIIGGAQIYNLAIESNIVNSIFVSFIYKEYEGDTFFPKIKWGYEVINKYDEFEVRRYDKDN